MRAIELFGTGDRRKGGPVARLGRRFRTRSDAQLVYFGRAIPWLIIDAMPYFRKWKLQPVSRNEIGRDPI